MLRPKTTDRVVRWIGVGKRRLEQVEDAEAEAFGPHVVRLSWADTFGRPVRVDTSGVGQTAATGAQVLQLRRPSEIADAPRRPVNQPPVPVLR